MQFSDKWLFCEACHQQFLWDAGEQAWYLSNNLLHQPRHCKNCRDRLRARRRNVIRKFARLNCDPCGDATHISIVV